MSERVNARQSDASELQVSEAAVTKATGRGHAEWFALLDAWGAIERRHAEIAAWLVAEHGVSGWWSQSITVAYERARGRRSRHEMRDGFQVGVNRTIAADAEHLLDAFLREAVLERWLPGGVMTPRRTTAPLTARFDWLEPPSRVAVYVTAKGAGRATVSIVHEKLSDAASAEHLKTLWRDRLTTLKDLLEAPDTEA
jgi:hypothetical protein